MTGAKVTLYVLWTMISLLAFMILVLIMSDSFSGKVPAYAFLAALMVCLVIWGHAALVFIVCGDA